MTTPCLNFHNYKTVIQGSLRTKIMPWDAWLASGKHSINSCYSTTKGLWEQWWETSVSPECCELNCTHHRVPLGGFRAEKLWGQPGVTQVNLRTAFVECTNPCDYLQSICIDGERAWMSTEAGREKYKIKENSEGRNKRTLPAKVWSKKEKEDLKNTYKTSKTSRCLATHYFWFFSILWTPRIIVCTKVWRNVAYALDLFVILFCAFTGLFQLSELLVNAKSERMLHKPLCSKCRSRHTKHLRDRQVAIWHIHTFKNSNLSTLVK